MTNPRARRNDIFSDTLGSETILYDKSNHRAHSLNRSAALVWQSADGQKSVDELAELLHRELGVPADRSVVLLALEELAIAGLLEKPLETAVPEEAPSRREVARRLALAGASAAFIPFIASVIAPTPAMASSDPITKTQAANDLLNVDVKAGLTPGYYTNRTAQNDLVAANAAYGNGQYATEISDLNGALAALGLPPLP